MAAKSPRAPKQIKQYDFERPEKFSKEQLRTLEMIYTSGARGLTTHLSTLLRTTVEVEFQSLYETSYGDFFNHTVHPAFVALLSISPLVGRAMMELDPELTFAIIDRLNGGAGRPIDARRDLTDIEKELIGQQVISRIARCLADAWGNVAPMKPELETIIGSTLFSQVALPEDRVMLAAFQLRFGGNDGRLCFGVPVTSFDPVLSKLSAQMWFTGGRDTHNEASTANIRSFLDRTDVTLVAELGRTELTVQDLLDLQEGDIICLHSRADQDITVRVDTLRKFQAKPGLLNGRLGVKITRILEDDPWITTRH